MWGFYYLYPYPIADRLNDDAKDARIAHHESSSCEGDGDQDRQEVHDHEEGDNDEDDKEKESINRGDDEQEGHDVDPNMLHNHRQAIARPPPTIKEEMQVILVRLLFSQTVAEKQVEIKG